MLLVFVTITSCEGLAEPTAQLPNTRLVVESETDAADEAIPVPLKLIVCGELEAVSIKLMVALCVPVATGLKITEILQLAPAARLPPADPQVLGARNDDAFAPVTEMLLK